MANILDCRDRMIKIGKTSITIKDDEFKTRGIVLNITKFKDLKPNKSSGFYHLLKACGAWGNICIDTAVVYDEKLYVLRNMSSKLFHEKYGYYSDVEKEKEEKLDTIYNNMADAGIKIIPCIIL